MTRMLIGAFAAALVLASGAGFAGDTKNPPATATQPAPDAKTGDATGACMPGGSCCGSAACKEASNKPAGEASMPAGCPCQRRKAATENQQAQ